MGYYIQTPGFNKGKADIIIDKYDAIETDPPKTFGAIPEGLGLVVVVDNGPFEAVAYVYSPAEFTEMVLQPDRRRKRYLYMDKIEAEKASGYA